MIKNEHITPACLLSPVQVGCHPLHAQQAEVKRLSFLYLCGMYIEVVLCAIAIGQSSPNQHVAKSTEQ